MAWDAADEALRAAIKDILTHRRQSPMLQTGFLDVTVKNADTLIIRRTARSGQDVFGSPLTAPDAEITITRQLRPFAGGAKQ